VPGAWRLASGVWRLAEGDDVRHAMRRANVAAGLAVRTFGTAVLARDGLIAAVDDTRGQAPQA
jgi:bifunctional ADP-heptose synthase (sugar kinase/adenylyltransferase)